VWYYCVTSVPPTSSVAEKNWSGFSKVHTKLRYRLTNDYVQKLVAIRANLQLAEKLNADNSQPTTLRCSSEATASASVPVIELESDTETVDNTCKSDSADTEESQSQ
jgi:hypothetical protein